MLFSPHSPFFTVLRTDWLMATSIAIILYPLAAPIELAK